MPRRQARTPQQVVSMHPALLLIADDRQSGGRVWRFKSQRSVRTVLVVVPDLAGRLRRAMA